MNIKKQMTKKLMTRTVILGPVLAAMLGTGILIGCAGDTEHEGGREANRTAVTQVISEQGGGESGGEHRGGGEGTEGGNEGAGGEGAGSEEASGANLAPDETFDMVRSGARLVLNYDAPTNAFTGTVENTTNSTLTRVRIEVHLSNGTELGPTTPVDMAPGQTLPVTLPSTQASFAGWIAHAEVGGGGGEASQAGGESGGEHGGSGGESGSESGNEAGGGEGGAEAGEAAMSSPIIPLGQTWNGVLGGLAVDARYDAATRSVQSTVQNTLSQMLCYVQAEPHLKSGTTTVGELGPDVMGHLSPGQTATTSVSVDSEPGLAGVSYDGYVVHLEVFDCAGTGPVPHTGGEGGEGGGGEGAGGEGHGPGGEGGNESGGEEGSANQLAPDEIFDEVRGGARLVMGYDAASNAFSGIVENTTNSVLTRVRIEVHLSNGTELGPTTPVDMAPGQALRVNLSSTQAPFTGWIAHAEVGGGESGGEGGGEHGSGSESGGEHGGGRESGGEHGGGRESGGGEHGGRGESRGGG